MPLSPGARLGVYEVAAKIGEGGMGEVYRARDTKLNRDVALKVLPDLFASDPDRLARFEREAQLLASLNHPNIGGIYGLEESEGVHALALELIEGPTLADRIGHGPIPVDEAVAIARQIADALEAAHEQGIIHRDLKPANIKLKDDGIVKVLDFGLAKALEGEAGGDPSQSPTLTAAATQAGAIMGTAAYMAPEQAKGKVADKRADIWSFGVVLLEMLTGERGFSGETISETLAAVMMREPDLDRLPADLPSKLGNLLRRCLQKDPRQRVRDIGDVRLAMDGAFETTVGASSEPIDVAQLHPWQRPVPLTVGVFALLLIVGLSVWMVTRPEPTPPPDLVRFTLAPPDAAPLGLAGDRHDLTISPDGTLVVYDGPGTGAGPELNLRRVDQLEAAPLRGTRGGSAPFVSPDGEWVGFQTGNTSLQKVSILGGPAVALTEAPNGIYGASWGTDDQIIFGTNGAGLFRVSGGGGEPEVLTTLNTEEGEINHLWPSIIPDREAVVFVIGNGAPLTTGQLAVLDLPTRDVKRLGLAGVSPHYVSTGHLVYAAEDGAVRAVPFDAASLEVTGNPVPLVEGVVVKLSGAANFSISDNGRLVYTLGAGGGTQRSLVWVDREGREEAINAEAREYLALRVSPDGERAAVVALDGEANNADLLIYDLVRNIPTRFTFDPASDSFPVWSPDGERVVFASTRDGSFNLFSKAADGTGEAERLATSTTAQLSSSLSPDGQSLVIAEDFADTGWDIAVLAMDGASESALLVRTQFADYYPEISPDGQWMAYASDESGELEIYVRPFPNVDEGKWQVSGGGGTRPVWAPDGRELFYRRPRDLAIVTAPIIETEPTFRPGNPEVLFDAQDYAYLVGPRNFDVAPDGRFMMIKQGGTTSEDAAPPAITVVLNWFQELTERVPVR